MTANSDHAARARLKARYPKDDVDRLLALPHDDLVFCYHAAREIYEAKGHGLRWGETHNHLRVVTCILTIRAEFRNGGVR